MSILVVHASKHGATREIAERIVDTLELAGQRAEARPVERAGDLAEFSGFVVGSAVYIGHWMKDAAAFVRDNRDLLAQRPVWLFSSGPLGTDLTDAHGTDVRTAAEPKEIAELREAIGPRDHRVFFGALDPAELTFPERALRRLPAARGIMPEGDFRDWAEIEQWARGIAQEMTQPPATHEADKPWDAP